jgi:hypothetical protein
MQVKAWTERHLLGVRRLGDEMNKILFALAAVFFSGNLWAIDVQISTSVEGNANPTIIGNTNLPDSTSLMVTISRQQDSYRAQSKTKVSRGKFYAGPFSRKGEPLNPGVYKLDISTPLATLQPPEVQAVIGKSGNNLKGMLIKTLPFGHNVVKYQKEIWIGENASISGTKPTKTQHRLQPIEIVKDSPCKQGGTIQTCLNQKLNVPAVRDLGWSVKEASGKYIVEKKIHINGLRSPTIYRWSVTSTGSVSPENGHALSLSTR